MKCARQKYKRPFFNWNLRWDNQNLTVVPPPTFEVRRTLVLKFIYPFGMFNLLLLSYWYYWEFVCFGGNCSSISKRCNTPIHCPAEEANLFVVVFKYSSSIPLSLQSDPFLVDCCYRHSWLKGSTLSGLSGGYPVSYKNHRTPRWYWFNMQLF